ncbi:MAG: MaoC family dehydratase N-terminal domain-containing protein [Dehalococcoidales bacterium]|nr:MaoC family dehydratase N-terminal domain-containing protein [Dehalococcoidales bacterium]
MKEKLAAIDAAMVATARAEIGKVIVPRGRQWNEVATADGIYHAARGVGDDNPLWWDRSYAGKTRWGALIAPPYFVYACERGGIQQRLFAGAHALFAGDDWDFFKPICENDRVANTLTLAAINERESKFAGTMWDQVEKLTFKNQNGEVVATCHRHIFRYERTEKPRESNYTPIKVQHYTPQELEAIENDIRNEERRGASPRYWEDLKSGDELTPVVKGPLTVTDIIAWEMGLGGSAFTLPHELAHAFWRRHPKAAVIERETGAPDFPVAVHWVDSLAQDVGLPAAYDIGPQRICWFGHLMSNWIGDDGFLRKLYVQVRSPNLRGDTTWCKGKITRKYIADGMFCADLDLWMVNQRGATIAKATATAYLPSKERGPVALPPPPND